MSRSVKFHLKPQRESQSCTLLAKPTTYKAPFALTFSFVANPAMPVIFSMTNPFTGGAVVASISYFSSCSPAWSARAFISLRRWFMQLLRIEQVKCGSSTIWIGASVIDNLPHVRKVFSLDTEGQPGASLRLFGVVLGP